MRKFELRYLCCALVIGSLVCGNVSAATATYTISPATLYGGNVALSVFDTFTTAQDMTVQDSTNLSALPQFDPLLGILNEVQLSFSGHMIVSLEIFGGNVLDDGLSNSANGVELLGVGVRVPIAGNLELTPLWLDQPLVGVGCSSGAFTGSCNGSNGTDLMLESSAIFTGSEMNAFIGSGALEALSLDLLFAITNGNVNNLDDAFMRAVTSFDSDVTVKYVYDAAVVPIPAAAWLFGSGLIGLIGVARRKAHS